MGKTYKLPKGKLVEASGLPTLPFRGYLVGIENISKDVNAVDDLDSGTSYSNDQLRDAYIALLAALKG